MIFLVRYLFFIFLGFAFCLILVFLLEEMKTKHRQTCDDQLMRIYLSVWNGSSVDRVAAWQRVIVHFEHFNHDRRLILQAKKRKEELEHYLSDDMTVGPKGNLLDRKA